jgi:hypothetical protein
MQNQLEDGTVLFTEQTDISGFVIREMLQTKSAYLRFQAGHYGSRPMQIPVYGNGSKITHHKLGDDIQTFKLEGTGRTRDEAISNASTALIRADIQRKKL